MPNAIISVYDKKNLDYLGKELCNQGFDIYATSGTLTFLKEYKIKALPIEEITNNPQGFDDCFSSLSFNTLCGVLTNGSNRSKKHDIKQIDIVVYNFYPTWEKIQTIDEFNIRNVDLGGPTMIKAAAINYKDTIPIVSPARYSIVSNYQKLTLQTRIELAKEALAYCSWYDGKLSEFLGKSKKL